MKISSRVLVVFICILLILSALTGCSEIIDSPSYLENGYIMPSENKESCNFVFVCPILDNQYWQNCVEGIKRADMELGTNTIVIGSQNEENFEDDIIKYFSSAIEMKPDGIITYAGISQINDYIDKAAEEGIPVITIDADADTESRIAYVGTNLYSLGFKVGESMLHFCDSNIKIGYICSYTTSTNEFATFDAFQDAIHDFDMEVVAQYEGHNDPTYSYYATEKMLSENLDIKAIFCTGGLNITGAAQYIEEHDLDIALVGLDYTETNREYVRKGIIDALVAQSPEAMGYTSVYVMKEYLDKQYIAEDIYDTDVVLITLENVETFDKGEFVPNFSLKKLRVGYYDGDTSFQSGFSDTVRKTGFAYEYYQTIATLAGWKYEYVYGTRSELIQLLKDGEIDIIAGIYKSDTNQDDFLLSSMDMGLPSPKRYFAINKNRVDLLTELNGAMWKLYDENPNYVSDLYSKYYSTSTGNNVLTESERNYLSSISELRFGYLKNNLPLCDQNSNGDPIGLVKEVMIYIAGFVDLPILPVAYDTIDMLDAALKNGEIDIAFPSYSDIWFNEQNGFKQTDPFISDRVMLIYSGNYSADLMSQVAANRNGIGQSYYMAQNYPNSELHFYDKREDVFEAILNGEEQCTIGFSSIIQRFLYDHPQYDDFHIAYLDADFLLSLVVNEANSYLISILNKALNNMGSTAISSAMLTYTGIEKNTTLSDFIMDNSVLFVIILTLFILFLIVIFTLYFRQAKRFRNKLEHANATLQQALSAAETASKAKTRFLSSMSHDIRTPMNAILGMTTIASKYPDDTERVRDCISKIASTGQLLLTLINDVLDISHIESGRMSLNPIEFSLTGSINELKNITESSAKEKGLELNVFIDNVSCDTVYADKVRMEQLFMNLLSNAIKYTPTGGKVTVHLNQTGSPESDTAHLIFTVEDNGIGMSEDFMEKMYETFTRAQDTRISKIQGTGLGLSIVKQVVDMMGGTIQCESKEQVGTKFTVDLDINVVHKDDVAATVDDSSGEIAGLHLLVAEDNELNWEVISELLDIEGITCERAENGQICIDMLSSSEKGHFDMVLMDVQMPVLNGKDATMKIRESEREDMRSIPIIAMTADAFAEDIAKCRAAGMNGHVAKPVSLDKLVQEMKKVLSEINSSNQ